MKNKIGQHFQSEGKIKKNQKVENFILIQIKDPNDVDRTITTFNGEPHHAALLKDYITTIFINQTGGQTIWIEIPAGEPLGTIL